MLHHCPLLRVSLLAVWLTLGTAFLFLLPAQGQVFEYIGIKDGLASRRVLSIEQDAQGYTWILTHKGVDRYDGSQFTHYKLRHAEKDMYFYPDLNHLHVDARQTLWEYGKDGKIFRYDLRRDAFEQVFDLKESYPDTRDYPVTSVYFCPTGHIWFHCHGQMVEFDTQDLHSRTVPTGQLPSPIDAMVTDGKDGYFLASGPHLYHASYTQGELRYLGSHTLGNVRKTTYLYYHPLTRQLIVNTLLDGVYLIDTDTHEVRRPSLLLKDIGINIIQPFFDSPDQVLIATDGYGVCRLDIRTGELTPFLQEDNLSPNKMNGSIVKDLLLDKEHRIWNVIYPTGITIYTQKYPAYQWLKHSDSQQSLTDNRINAILQDSDGDIWFATCNGVSCLNPSTRRWTHYLSGTDSSLSHQNRIVLSLCEESPGIIAVGGYMAGVYRIDKHSRQVKFDDLPHPATPDKYIRSILRDSDGNLWAGGYQQLGRLDAHTRTVSHFPSLYPITHLKEKDGETLWVGTIDGLFTFDKQRQQLERYSLQTGCVNTIHQTPDGSKTFIGTYGNGLFVIDNRTQTVLHFHKDNCSLENNNIYSIVPNAYDDLFLGTENGLTLFDVTGHKFTNWTHEQGLLSASFNQNAAARTREGQLFFGTDEGVIVLPANTLLNEDFSSHMLFSNLNVMYRNVHPGEKGSPLTRPLDETDCIRLSYQQNTFSLNVSSINYDNPSIVSYSWCLEGFYDEWTTPSDANLIRYTNLSPGTYKLRVRAINVSNNCILEERSLQIIVERPFWMTFWAFLLYGLLLIGAFYAWMRYQTLRRKRIASQEKINFFIHTAHDIRTPLTLIKAPLGEILKNEELSPQGLYNLNLAIQNTDNLSNLANNLMNFQKEELYSPKVTVTAEELNDYLTHYLRAFEALARHKDIQLTYTSDFERLEVWIDRNKMDSILLNLLTNAFKYTPKGGKIALHASQARGYWNLTVNDTGIGIPRKDQKKMFKLLFRGGNATNQLITGTGIGMLLTYRLIRNHQGKITFTSTENVGTSFHLTFPIQSPKYVQKPPATPGEVTTVPLPDSLSDTFPRPIAPAQADADAPRLLVVEDNQSLRHFLQQTLSAHYQVDEAANGKEALDRMSQRLPDLVISDVMMPIMGGEELCTHLKSHIETSHIPVILLTALADREYILRGLQNRADQYIVKPFDLMLLEANIASLLENRKLLQQQLRQTDRQAEPMEEELLQLSPLDRNFIDQVTRSILDNMAGDLSVDTLCAHMGMSRTSFYNKMKALMGCSPNDYIRQIRMQEAARLLRSRQHTVAEVADRLGFADPKYFTDAFKKFYGMPPSTFMKNQ